MKDSMFDVKLFSVPNIPLVKMNDDIASIIYERATEAGFVFEENDVIVVASKIIAKAENAVVALKTIVPSEQAKEIAEKTGRSPNICQVYLDEAAEENL